MRCACWIESFLLCLFGLAACGGDGYAVSACRSWRGDSLVLGAEVFSAYLSDLKGKTVAVVSNQTGVVPVADGKALGGTGFIEGLDGRCYRHLVDVWLDSGLAIKKIFSPEHGFRGTAEAGAKVKSGVDVQTGLPVVSLYGSHKKPAPEDLQGIEAVVFDLQDVGVRFYTYVSTLHYVMEACAESGIPVWVLDRPNPHAGYIDGPVLDTVCCRSFVGLHPVPMVYGMTIGEYARMINGEGWLKNGVRCDLKVVPLVNYRRGSTRYVFPVPPSPNLRTMKAIHAYPSLCLFEGTPVSLGRGTSEPFSCFGFPGCTRGNYSFTPRAMAGLSENPPCKNQVCTGFLLPDSIGRTLPQALNLDYLLQMYAAWPQKESFFTSFFAKLAGTPELAAQIKRGEDAATIRASWQPALRNFDTLRRKYLLYP
ncbi:MAG: DUF1343 domain-containing protein [Bacteroidales bacterium]|nr:DUF1343 domain-containing protein [Bacteroidales bacterium]